MKIINISGEIGWDVMPADVRKQLDEAKGKDIEIQIASPGGFVFDGIEIYNMIRDYKRKNPNAQIMATIKGMAASMASYIAMNPAIDLLTAEDNAVFMIHNVWGVSIGDYREMLKTAEIFQGLTDILSVAYSNKSGKENEDIRKMMDSESWFFGAEIKEAGFVDEMIKTEEKKEKVTAISESKVKMKILSEKLEKSPVEYQKIAAMLRPENNNEEHKQESTPSKEDEDIKNQNPAQREKLEEVSVMTLDQLLKDNPAAKIEYDQRMAEKFEAGKIEAKSIFDKRIEAASKYLDSAEYPKQIRDVSVDVIKGSKSLETLDTMVASVDMFKELAKSAHAQAEGKVIGDTPGEQVAQNPDGDFNAMLNEDKGVYGLGEVR